MTGLRSAVRQVELRPLTERDLPTVAAIHAEAFPGRLLTALGSGAVERYYRWQLSGPHRDLAAIGAVHRGELVGYLFAGIFDGAVSGFLRKNAWFLAGQVLLRMPVLAATCGSDGILRGFRILTKSVLRVIRPKVRSEGGQQGSIYGSLALAVIPRYQILLGIGVTLLRAFEAEAGKRGYSELELSVEPGNAQAARLYESMGWVRAGSDGAWRGRMTKRIECCSKTG